MKKNLTDSDLLSDLPLGIIHIILALIPIREAVRTCILSRQWRSVWTSLPELVFDEDSPSKADKSNTKYEDLISRVLFRHTGPIYKFKLCGCRFSREIPIFEDWIYFLSRNGIKELILDSEGVTAHHPQLVHSSIYSCVNLTSLKYHLGELDPLPPNFKGFSYLKTLNLFGIDLPHNGLGRLVSVCPLLESLTVVYFAETELIIKAPNLKHLDLLGHVMKICLHAPLIAEIELYVEKLDEIEGEKPLQVCNYMDLLGGVADLEKLTGSIDFLMFLSLGIDCCHNVLVFHHLKSIELHDVNFQEAKEMSILSRLLIGAPNLRELKIVTDHPYDAPGPETPHLSFGIAPSYKLEKLRVVTVKHFDGLPMEMELVKILLESSPVLETMSIEFPTYLHSDKKKKKKISDELRGYSCTSPIAILSTLDFKSCL